MKRKRSIGGLILCFAVLAAVIVGLLLPEYLLKLDRSPAFDLDGYQTVEISSTASTDYAWHLRVIADSFWHGTGEAIDSVITNQYTDEQQENIRQRFVSQLDGLEDAGVLAPGTGEKISRVSVVYLTVYYLFDPAELRGIQCAEVTMIDPDKQGMWLLDGVMDLESGKILGFAGYTTVWSDLLALVETGETTAGEILENYAGYLGLVEPTEDFEVSEEAPDFSYSDDSRFSAEVRLAAPPSDPSSAMQIWIEFMAESFVIRI